MKIFKLFVVAVSLLTSIKLRAQIEYGLSTSVGINNFKYESWSYWYEWDGTPVEDYLWAEEQYPAFSWSVGGFVKKQVARTPLSIELGADFQYLQSEKYSIISKTSVLNNMNRIYIPLKVHIKISKSFSAYTGASYAYTVNYNIKTPIYNMQNPNYGYLGGFDFKLLNTLSLGAYFYNSFYLDYELSEHLMLGFKAGGIMVRLSYTLSPMEKN